MASIPYPPIPADTMRASEDSFGKNHPYLKIGDSLKEVLSGVNIAAVASADVTLADSFWPNSLATILQFWEELTDRQMANATRTRVDLKYALHLPLYFPGIKPSALCKFRQQVQHNQVGREAFQQLVERVEAFIDNQKKRLPDSIQMVTEICMVSRYEIVMETMRNAVETLASNHPEWLRTMTLPHWYRRYYYGQNPQRNSRTFKNFETILQSVGEDGQHLIKAVERSEVSHLMELPEIQTLCHEWQNQFEVDTDQLRLRPTNCSNCTGRI